MDVDALIANVYKRRPIWDKRDKLHSNRNAVDELWQEIAALVDYDEYSLRKKWKYLRDNFSLEYNKWYKYKRYVGGSSVPQSKWAFFPKLMFMEDVIAKSSAGALPPLPLPPLSYVDYTTYLSSNASPYSPDSFLADSNATTIASTTPKYSTNSNSNEPREEVEGGVGGEEKDDDDREEMDDYGEDGGMPVYFPTNASGNADDGNDNGNGNNGHADSSAYLQSPSVPPSPQPQTTQTQTPQTSSFSHQASNSKKRKREQNNNINNNNNNDLFQRMCDVGERELQYLRLKEAMMLKRKNEDNGDTDLMFLKSLLPHIRKIPQHLKLRFQCKVQTVVEEFAYYNP